MKKARLKRKLQAALCCAKGCLDCHGQGWQHLSKCLRAMLQRATYQAVRALHTAQSYLAASKPLEAAALFQRTAQRAQQAEAAWDDLERPDADALRQLAALAEQAQVRSLGHIESRSKRRVGKTVHLYQSPWSYASGDSVLVWQS